MSWMNVGGLARCCLISATTAKQTLGCRRTSNDRWRAPRSRGTESRGQYDPLRSGLPGEMRMSGICSAHRGSREPGCAACIALPQKTPYQLDCENLCEWCAKGLPIYTFGEGIGGRWHDLLVPSQKNCTARSRDSFEASLIARAQQRSEERRVRKE